MGKPYTSIHVIVHPVVYHPKQTRSHSEVEGSCNSLLDSFYNLAILGNFQKVDTPKSHVVS